MPYNKIRELQKELSDARKQIIARDQLILSLRKDLKEVAETWRRLEAVK